MSTMTIKAVSQAETSFEVDIEEYWAAKADGTLGHLVDPYVSDMDGETWLIEPDGTEFTLSW